MNDYFVAINFKGALINKDSELIKNYYNLKIIDCEVIKFE